jgi:formylglycine-generating enzyme
MRPALEIRETHMPKTRFQLATLAIGIVAWHLLCLTWPLCSAQEQSSQSSNSPAFNSTVVNTSEQRQGFSKDLVPNVRCVEVEGGYLIPYSMRIPGTDVAFEMIPIPGGVATIGSTDNSPEHRVDESPQIKVTIEPMWVGKCEVTQAEFDQFLRMDKLFRSFKKQGIRKITAENASMVVSAPTQLYEPSFRAAVGYGPDMPAIGMTQFAAKQYTKWLSGLTGLQYRLPTEAEWEYACRAGSSTAYHFGDDAKELDQYAWFEKNSEEQLHRTASKTANPWGLHDMHGSAREWAIDGYTATGYQALARHESPIHFIDAIQWASRPDQRIARGGSWGDKPADLRSAARFSSNDIEMKAGDPEVPTSPWWYTHDPARTIGFRVVRSFKVLDDATIQKFYNPDHQDIIDDLKESSGWERTVQGVADPSLANEMRKGKF